MNESFAHQKFGVSGNKFSWRGGNFSSVSLICASAVHFNILNTITCLRCKLTMTMKWKLYSTV